MELNISVNSEIGKLKGVIIHTPGREIENMTPKNAERALYSDILNLNVAQSEYNQLSGVLNRFTKTFEVEDLLRETLDEKGAREELIASTVSDLPGMRPRLEELNNNELSRQLIEGVLIARDNLTKYLSKEKFDLRPLHNFFFTRDSAVVINDRVLISSMASKVRQREAIIMKTIFRYHPLLKTNTFELSDDSNTWECDNCTVEGGDILVARKDILVIGNGIRTSTEGIDSIIEHIRKNSTGTYNIIVQELPYTPESFIHLDMVFTFLDRDKFMAYEPLIMKKNKFQTVHITIDNNRVKSIRDVQNLPAILSSLGMPMDPVLCGGSLDQWIQEREQWHSGANFFALEPGKLLGYSRNVHTLEEMSNKGFSILKARDVIDGKADPSDYDRCVIGIDGAELSRGGGGARCMTMPVSREKI